MSCSSGVPELTDIDSGKAVKLYKGDTITLSFTLRQSNGEVLNISSKTDTDYKLSGHTALDGTSPTWSTPVSGSFGSDGSDGVITFQLTPTQLATVYDTFYIELIDTSDSADLTLGQWKTAILQDVKI